MLCCVSRKAFKSSSRLNDSPQILTRQYQAVYNYSKGSSIPETDNQKDEPIVLLPCSICGRTFKPQSLEKHIEICERTAAKKRRPFDSAKQRIQGTELAEFLPKIAKRKIHSEDKIVNSSWKQTHDEFIKTIRAARGETIETAVNRQTSSILTPGPPTRSNEKGSCPTCNRQFGIKAYDRHVAWCKERITRAPATSATNVAKERLEARIKYRAPVLKNRRLANKEKYAPTSKKSSPTLNNPKAQENVVSLTNNMSKHAESPSIKQPAVVERPSGPCKGDSVVASGPLKSRLADRSTKPIYDLDIPHNFPHCTLTPTQTGNDDNFQDKTTGLDFVSMSNENDQNNEKFKGQNWKKRSKQNIVSARSHVNPKVDDVTVNDDIVEMIGEPCNIHMDNELITWKQINESKTNDENTEYIELLNDTLWNSSVEKLDETYLIKDGDDITDTVVKYDAKELSLSTSPVRFNLDITCASTPVSFKDVSSIDEEEPIMVHSGNLNNSELISTIFNHQPHNIFINKVASENIRSTLYKTHTESSSINPSSNFTADSLDSIRSNEILMKHKLRKKMNLLRDSTDSIISTIETNDEWKIPRIAPEPSINIENKKKTTSIFPNIPSNRRMILEEPRNYRRNEIPYWRKKMKNSTSPLINHIMKNPTNNFLPPVVQIKQRSCIRDSRPAWTNYVRRRPDFNLVLTGRTGVYQDYDPFLLAERQLNDLLSDTCSDNSFPDSSSNHYKTTSSSIYPLTHSSAFVKYPKPLVLDNGPEKRASSIAPPSEFDDSMSTGFSSDSTETNSLSRELFTHLELACHKDDQANKNKANQPILGRRVIIDKSKALGTKNNLPDVNSNKKSISADKNRKYIEKIDPKVTRSDIIRSKSVRSSSAPKIPDRKDSGVMDKASSRSSPNYRLHSRSNNYGSNLSLSSIVSSEIDSHMKQSNALFDDFVNSFEEESGSYPSLRSFLKNDSLSISSPVQLSQGTTNGRISDEDLSSPDSYKRQDHSKLSADSAYSSLNRKYSNEKDADNKRDNQVSSTTKCKLSKFCHECGTRFPQTAKFCCECGIQRLAL